MILTLAFSSSAMAKKAKGGPYNPIGDIIKNGGSPGPTIPVQGN